MSDNDRNGRSEWIDSVLREHEGPLIIYTTRLLGDVERARDVVQDAFLKLWQVDRAQVDGHVAKWLYTVCRNRAFDVRRKEHRMTPAPPGSMRMEMEQAPDAHAMNPPDESEETGRLRDIVAALPERQQEAVRLKFQGGLSYKEIAEVMNTTVNNVGVTLHTAIRTVRERLSLGDSEAGSINDTTPITREFS